VIHAKNCLSWGALVGASGSLIAIVSFLDESWKSRKPMHMPRPKARIPLLRAALAKADLVAAQLAEARIGFARDYAKPQGPCRCRGALRHRA